MDICREIFIERSGTAALDFIERYKRLTDGLLPDLIIFEFRGAGDLFFLNHMQQCGMEKSLLMMFSLQVDTSIAEYPPATYFKTGYISSSDILSTLQQKMLKAAVA